MSCNTPYFQGKADCEKLLQRVAAIGITKKGTTFTDTTFISETTWHTGLADDAVLQGSLNTIIWQAKAYEKTTDDPEVQTSNLGIKDKTQDPAPSADVFINASACDYKTLHGLEGISFDVVLFLTDGTQVGTRKSDGTLKGFRCVLATKRDLPESDNAQNSYHVMLFFRSASEFEKAVYFKPDYSVMDLIDYIPVGLDLRITTAYNGGTVVVQVDERCTKTGKTGLSQTTDWEILSSNATPTVAVTVVSDDGLGVYTLTIKKDNDGTPANLATGDNYTLICHDDDGTYFTYLSNTVSETVV